MKAAAMAARTAVARAVVDIARTPARQAALAVGTGGACDGRSHRVGNRHAGYARVQNVGIAIIEMTFVE